MTRALLALLVITFVSGTAVAEKRRIVGILDVSVEGVPKDIATRFEQDLEKQLDSRSYWLAPKSRMQQLLDGSTKWTPGCVLGSCLVEVRTQTGAELVLLAAITGSGTSFGYVVTLVRTDTGQVLSQQSDRCDVCTVNEALTSATQAAVTLLTSAPEVLPDDAAARRTEVAQVEALHVATLRATRRRHRRLALATTLAGVAVAGAGIALYVLRDRADYGLATAAAGGGLALGGAVLLTF